MTKAEALRLKPGTVVRVQHANCRPIVPEKFVTVESARWYPNPWHKGMHGSEVREVPLPLKSSESKGVSSAAEWVSIRDTEGKDWDCRELVKPKEGKS